MKITPVKRGHVNLTGNAHSAEVDTQTPRKSSSWKCHTDCRLLDYRTLADLLGPISAESV
jgi:hypothetical protein